MEAGFHLRIRHPAARHRPCAAGRHSDLRTARRAGARRFLFPLPQLGMDLDGGRDGTRYSALRLLNRLDPDCDGHDRHGPFTRRGVGIPDHRPGDQRRHPRHRSPDHGPTRHHDLSAHSGSLLTDRRLAAQPDNHRTGHYRTRPPPCRNRRTVPAALRPAADRHSALLRPAAQKETLLPLTGYFK